MKMIKYTYAALCCFLLVIAILTSCRRDDRYVKPVSDDTTKPEAVTNVNVINYNGGAKISYTLPKTSNLLYVLAKYKINDKTGRETKASYYKDTINVEGFAKSQDYEVTLYSVSRSNVMSDPVIVKVHPETPPYLLLQPKLELAADFGGVNIKTLNDLKKPLGLVLLAFDASTGKMEIQDQHFSAKDTINYSVRGFAAVERKFGVYTTDEYGNISDTTFITTTPIFETLLDKGKFSPYHLASDSEIGFGWVLPNLWDNKTDGSSDGWHTNSSVKLPALCTFDMGVTAQLSRFILWERPDQFAYTAGNPRNFTIWGSAKSNPADSDLPLNSPVGTVIGDWVNLGNYHYPDPPSGLQPGFTNAADNAFVKAGVNFNIPLNSPKVRYIRIGVRDIWSGGSYAHLMEISMYGNPQ